MLNNSKIYRSGCPSRVIFYSQTSKGHEYNYGNPIISITGRNSRYIPQTSSAERKLFSNIKHHPLPNSKRTINPDYENAQIKQFNKAKKYNWKNCTISSGLCENENKKIKPSIKIYDKKNQTSEELKTILNKKNEIKGNYNKHSYSFYIKNKYDYSSEILNLPGGSKRIINDIKDDFDKNKNIEKKNNLNTMVNCFRKRDFDNSKIACLKPLLNNRNQIIRKNIINLTNNDCFSSDYNKKENPVNDMSDYKEFHDYNKYKYNKSKTIRRNIYEASKENDENKFQNDKCNNYKNNGLFNNYIQDSFKNEKNDLITHYARKRNMKSYNKLFNEIHQENSKYSLIKYYGENYSKKNYSQFEIN